MDSFLSPFFRIALFPFLRPTNPPPTHSSLSVPLPVLQGAGGMLLIDPLFQRCLVHFCRSHAIPVVFDEVFTGCWRLGAQVGGILGGYHAVEADRWEGLAAVTAGWGCTRAWGSNQDRSSCVCFDSATSCMLL